ncbi:MAG: ABC transporter permease [Pseudotabrizicola sp.]|uniref:ABC transporter permease n=1 Tax=Pseudotabrizicola sp. TaxID=2939647 RepID=UPI002715BAFE|nr:ABC transporter permease [Pseudotabrizicola sp.]MDO9641020.1 ABC transporter permease [Pseudotabrizicola sp.]
MQTGQAGTIRLGYTIVSILVIGFIVLPLVFIVWMSFFSNRILSFPPEGYTLDWYRRAWGMSDFRNGFFLSLQTSLIATVVAAALGLPASFALVRGRFKGREGINTILMSPMVVPGIVGGSALFVFFLEVEFLTGMRIAGSSLGLIIAHSLIALPWMIRLVTTSLISVNPFVEEAARSLGAGPLIVFWRITLPVIKPGVIAGSLFAFINSFIDLEKSIFLVGPDSTTLQIALINYLEWNFDSTIGAVATVQIALITVLLLITDRYAKLSRAF